MQVYVSNGKVFVKNGKFRMKCVEKYDVSVNGARPKFLDMLFDPPNLL